MPSRRTRNPERVYLSKSHACDQLQVTRIRDRLKKFDIEIFEAPSPYSSEVMCSCDLIIMIVPNWDRSDIATVGKGQYSELDTWEEDFVEDEIYGELNVLVISDEVEENSEYLYVDELVSFDRYEGSGGDWKTKYGEIVTNAACINLNNYLPLIPPKAKVEDDSSGDDVLNALAMSMYLESTKETNTRIRPGHKVMLAAKNIKR